MGDDHPARPSRCGDAGKVPKIRAGQRRTAERPATLDTFAGVSPQAAARATTVAVGEWTVNQSMVIGLQTEKPCLGVSSGKKTN